MPLVFAAIAPHGFPLIPDLAEDAGGARQTRAAMLDGARCDAFGDEKGPFGALFRPSPTRPGPPSCIGARWR